MASETISPPLRRFSWRAFASRNVLPLSCAVVLLVIALAPLAAHWIVPPEATMVRPRLRLRPPSELAWFGTDAMGRDVFGLSLQGAKLSLLVGLLTALAGGLIGTGIGLVTGYFRRLDGLIMRLMD
ncbi:MAG: ABC transporter permease, partial [Phyllobacterium sp.]